MIQAPTVEYVEEKLRLVWGDRVSDVVLNGWHCTARVSSERYYRVNGAEVLRLAILLDIDPKCVEFWPLGNDIELSIDTDSPTPAERPVPLPPVRALRSVPPAPRPTTDPKRRR